MKKVWDLIKKSFKEWSEDKAPRLAAALSYYMVFSLPPLIVLVVGMVGIVYSEQRAQQALLIQIEGLIGEQGGEVVATILENASRPGAGLIATLVGVGLLIFGATGFFTQLQDALNTIWEVKPKPDIGIMGVIRKRLLSFAMVLAIGFLLLVSLVISAGLSLLATFLEGLLPLPSFVFQIINLFISFGVITLLFAMMFKYIPDAIVAWKDVWWGAAITTVLFLIGRELLSLYLGTAAVGSAFGAFGALIVLLVWVYYSAQILFFGAEFTQVYANTYGQGVKPEENATWITEAERITQGLGRREPVPVTAVEDTRLRLETPALPAPRMASYFSPARILQVAAPALLAFLVTIAGSLAIVREQRKMETAPKSKARKRKKSIFEGDKWQK